MQKAYIQIILAASLWGVIGLFVRGLTALSVSQIQVTMLRALIAAVVLIPVLLLKDRKLFYVRPQHLWCFLGTGVISLTFFNLCYFTAMQHMTLSVASVLLYTAPVFVMLLSAPLFGEKITVSRLGALALVFGGCLMVTGVIGGGAVHITGIGLLYGLGAGIGYAMYSIFGRYALNRGYHSFTITFYTFLFSLLGCVPLADVGRLAVHMTPEVWLYAVGIGIICSVLPYLLYTKGLSGVDNSTASMLATLEPAVATLTGVLIFKETLAWYNLVGMILLFAGMIMLARAAQNFNRKDSEQGEKTMGKIKVILWDIDGTLLNFEEAEKYAIRKCFSVFGLGECTDAMLRSYSAINKEYWKRLERGEISKIEVLEGRFREFFEKYGLDTSVAAGFNSEYQIHLGDTTVFYENALETLRACKGKVLQYAVTNGTKIAQDRKLENSGLNNLLDGVFISEEIGIEKPMIGFFDKVFESIGAYDKEEVLIVGDSLTSDMQGGNNAGIVTCWFNPDKKENGTQLRIDYEINDLTQVLDVL